MTWREGGFESIFLMNVDGSDPMPFTDFGVLNPGEITPSSVLEVVKYSSRPAWSPDGKRIAFHAGRYMTAGEFTSIYTLGVDGSNLTRLTLGGNEYDATWSPDGRAIAYHAGREIFRLDVESLQWGNLTDCGQSESTCDSPAWSPVDDRIAYCYRHRGTYDIYVIHADGSDAVPLFTGNPSDAGYGCHLAWSPDGSRIAFASEHDGNPELYVMDADGTDVLRLTDDPALDCCPAWSPDGTLIAFSSDRAGGTGIYVMNTDGANVTRLTDGPDWWPAWEP